MFMRGKMKSCLKALGCRDTYSRDTCSREESELGVSFLLAQNYREARGKPCPCVHTGRPFRKGSVVTFMVSLSELPRARREPHTHERLPCVLRGDRDGGALGFMREADCICQSWLEPPLSPDLLLCSVVLPCSPQQVEPDSPSEAGLSDGSPVTHGMPGRGPACLLRRDQKRPSRKLVLREVRPQV